MHLDNVEDFFPLAPAQQGILFHTLHDPASAAYVGQLAFTFFEAFDEAAFERAWRRLIRRHAVLRSFFVWEDVRDPAQVVCADVDLPIERHDWRGLSEGEASDRLRLFLDDDRRRGLDLSRAPVMRLILIRLGEDRYRFIWSHHHILLDGWSVPLLLNEFLALYAAPADADDAALGLPARRPYRDYIAWLAQQDPVAAEAYWRRTLGGFHAPVAIGDHIAREGEAVDDSEVWQHERSLEPDLLERLREAGRSRRVTLNTIVQSAWAVLLARYTGRSDVVHGATVSGRPPELAGADEMIGLFINTLPLRVMMDEAMRLDELFQRVQDQQLETRQFEYSRLVDVQGWSDVPRGTPLFDTIVVFENYPASRATGGAGDQVRAGDLAFHQKTNYAVTLAVGMGTTLVLRCLFDPARVGSRAAARLLDHLLVLLTAIAEAPADARVGAIELLTAAERAQAIDRTPIARADETIVEQFAACVTARPAQVALVSDDERLTYAELDARATQCAHYLRQKGAAPERVVAIGLDRGVSLVVWILAALKAGAAYVPLDPSHPQPRLEALLIDSRAAIVVTSAVHAEKFAPVVPPIDAGGHASADTAPATATAPAPVPSVPRIVIDIERDSAAILSASRDDQDELPRVRPSNLAYIIYTSGSTGQPKGVGVEHRTVVSLVRGQAPLFGMAPGSQILQFAAATFDASVSEMFGALLTGATLHVASADALRPGEGLSTLLRVRAISLVTLPPTLLAVLPETDLPALRTLVSAGEALAMQVAERWARGRRCLNAYGPTETTVCATVSEPLRSGESIDIGRALPDTRVYILDAGLRAVPAGVAGEIHVGGESLARGYANQPALTAERFLPDPFAAAAGTRMYRTGDRARRAWDGRIEYLGRIDHQVKLRGYRIELGEIEARLERLPAVARACAIVREDRPGDQRLVAYVVARGAQKPVPRDLLGALRAELPDYMLPSPIIVLDTFPLTTSGKIHRAALPAPDGGRAELPAGAIAPRTDAERAIAAIWRDVLQLDAIGVRDNFFDLGGHSLLMLQVHGKVKGLFEKPISMIQMFGYPTIEALADFFTRPEEPQPARAFASIHERVRRKREAMQAAAARQDAS